MSNNRLFLLVALLCAMGMAYDYGQSPAPRLRVDPRPLVETNGAPAINDDGSITAPIGVSFAPDEPCPQVVLHFAGEAQKTLFVADYGFVMPALTDLLIAKHQAGVDVRCVFDKTEAGGKAEKAQLDKLQAAGVPFRIGTSTRHHIMHHKFMVVDGEAVLAGSYNFTDTAALESNFLFIVDSPAMAAKFTTVWNGIWTYMGGAQ